MLRELVYKLLDDDEGISEDAWNKLVDYLQEEGEFKLLDEITLRVSACNGRRYMV